MGFARALVADRNFRQRLTTGLVLAPIAVAWILFLPTPYVAALMAAAVLLGVWEWTRLIGIHRRRFRTGVVLLNAVLLVLLWALAERMVLWWLVCLGVVWWLLALLWLKRIDFAAAENLRNLEIKVVVGSLLILPAWSAGVLLHETEPHGAWWLMYALGLIWVADSFAYLVGRRYGSKKLAPDISPGKTREGVYGAVIASGLLALGAGLGFALPAASIGWFVLISLLTVLFSVVGDLFESLIKRHAHSKDSGHLIPGHGGVLDRLDSLLAALPVFTFGKALIGV